MIKIIENTKVVAGNYIYDLNRLNYESLNESEHIYASVNGNYLALAIQIATGQESLIVIVDMGKDKIVFGKKSQFVECVKRKQCSGKVWRKQETKNLWKT